MNIRRALKWGLVLMAFIAYKQLEGDAESDKPQAVYMAHYSEA